MLIMTPLYTWVWIFFLLFLHHTYVFFPRFNFSEIQKSEKMVCKKNINRITVKNAIKIIRRSQTGIWILNSGHAQRYTAVTNKRLAVSSYTNQASTSRENLSIPLRPIVKIICKVLASARAACLAVLCYANIMEYSNYYC